MGYEVNCCRSLSVSPGHRQLHAGQVIKGPDSLKGILEMDSKTTEVFLTVLGIFASDCRTNKFSLRDTSVFFKCLRIQALVMPVQMLVFAGH